MLCSATGPWRQYGQADFEHIPRFDIPILRDEVKFDLFNPGQKVALVTLYTSAIASYATLAEKNQAEYARRHGYTFYVYRSSIIDWEEKLGAWHSIVTWNKIM